MNAPVIFGRSDRTNSPNNLKDWTEWKKKLAKDNESLTALLALPQLGHGSYHGLDPPRDVLPSRQL